MKIRLRQNDKVKVLSGKDRGKKGKITSIDRTAGKAVVEGVNEVKKHIKGNGKDRKGEIISFFAPVDVSNLQLVCPKCGKLTRVEYKLEGEKKFRSCKKCKASF